MYGTDPPRASRHRRQRGGPPAACYVARAVTRPARTAKLGACAALAAALTALGGCGDDGQADDASGTYDVGVESVVFAARQRLAERNSFVLRVRNAGGRDADPALGRDAGGRRHALTQLRDRPGRWPLKRAGRDDGAGDTLTVRVADRPAKARVDPRSGRVLRE